ncbi:MAG: hypothetical protein GY694_01790 [Gammaproteobacteria bacterium]|nr:hypothetical protein [Gammaproteobacteria bacterium]
MKQQQAETMSSAREEPANSKGSEGGRRHGDTKHTGRAQQKQEAQSGSRVAAGDTQGSAAADGQHDSGSPNPTERGGR